MSINTSNELRKLIFQQAERYSIPLTHICKKVRVDYREFLKKYANIKELSKKDDSKILPDKKLVEIAELLGINVRIILVVKNDFDGEAMKLKLRDEFNDSKEKRVNTKA